ncbi:helix-turn-helix domain-containing protein [Paenarthrobacter nitroguajacolicus]|uniref:helix-turn-helix domain-containing protein n=1 Tax=Paenarthrobacter nitroguajacolicus TaxID=211146 RepID=UPI0040541AB9
MNLVHELKERGVGIRTLADPLGIDTSNPDGPMAQLAVIMLVLFAEMERTYATEHAIILRDKGVPIREIVVKTGLARTTLYRHLPSRPA